MPALSIRRADEATTDATRPQSVLISTARRTSRRAGAWPPPVARHGPTWNDGAMNVRQKAYGLEVALAPPYADAVQRTHAALKEEGFGVITEVDLRQALKEKILPMPRVVRPAPTATARWLDRAASPTSADRDRP
jgi:hypothetical protein